MKLTVTGAALAATLALVACDGGGTGREFPPPPGPPVPPSPALPMTAAKARLIMGSHSSACLELATVRYDIHACELKQGRPADEEALRTELRDLRWALDKLTKDEVTTRCAAMTTELRKTPKPQACW